jgi:hypothetical protein
VVLSTPASLAACPNVTMAYYCSCDPIARFLVARRLRSDSIRDGG